MKTLYIIAECGQGYAADSKTESINLALLLTKCAKASGADAVKFQLVIASELATPDYEYYDLFKTLELGYDGWEQISSMAKDLKIDLMFDIFGPTSLQMAEALNPSAIKIHPTDFTNIELIRKISNSSINSVIAGCGGASHSEIQITINELKDIESLTLLHGFQGYPTQRADNCLSRLAVLRDVMNHSSIPIKLGFGDHADPSSTDSTHIAATAIGYGVTVIEKHLTIAKCLKLEDYESALSPDEFVAFAEIMRNCQGAKSQDLVSNSSFNLPESEKGYRKAVERHVIARVDLNSNHIINASDICLKRSSSLDFITDPLLVIGKKSNQLIKANSAITLSTICK